MSWCFIIPYRDRAEHLKRFVSHYTPLFPGVPIYVIEQADDKPFNRAKLFQCGFLEIGRKYDYAAYHDVDMYVYPDYVKAYDTPNCPTHLATCASQFGFKNPYQTYWGGVCLLTTEHMRRSNGFSNEFWSRNAEDDEMRNNLLKKGFILESRTCYYECADHPRYYDRTLYPKNLAILQAGRNEETDGLTQCKYVLDSIEEKEGYTLIKVKL